MRKALLGSIVFVLGLGHSKVVSALPDWGEKALVPPGGRANIYGLTETEFRRIETRGRLHAQNYPVTVTGILPPYEPFRKLAEDDGENPLAEFFEDLLREAAGVKNFDSVMEYLGLHPYPVETDRGVFQVPYPDGRRPQSRLGLGWIEREGARGFTFSCAACHSSRLFGRTVLGMTNRFPRANNFFVRMRPVLNSIDPVFFQYWTGATDAEVGLLESSLKALRRVATREPVALGLDTSLSQVALSLRRRSEDANASPSAQFENFPRRDPYLEDHPADSKPAVWWNVKYKNRWLADGSVVSGNPIFTNFIWNEVGRGADLKELEEWLGKNSETVRELTAAVFASEAPKFTDFFSPEQIDLESAKRGEKHFNQACARCHGTYEKAWSLPEAVRLGPSALRSTVVVRPPAQTFIVDVGTDPNRYLGMSSLEVLNKLAVSEKNAIVIRPGKGYVPPPLVGIWARWPYFHNNSVPSLCGVLTRANKRPRVYYSGEAKDRESDFDRVCNGYPLGTAVPNSWKTAEHRFDTSRAGMTNTGHDEGIFLKDGREIFTDAEKIEIIQFLQTL